MDFTPVKDYINADFMAAHNIDSAWVMRNYHFHDAFEIYLSMSDGIQYFIEGDIYTVNKGDLFVFNHRDLHRTAVPAGRVYDRYIATFMPEFAESLSTEKTDLLECFLDRPPDFCYRVHLSEHQLAEITALFDKAIYYCSHPEAYGADVCKKLVLAELLIKVNACYRNAQNPQSIKPDREYKRIKEILNHIHHHLDSDLTLETLSRKFYLSKYHLGYLFKKVTGFTVNEYIISRRIMRAKELLKNNLPVSQVGERVGYTNTAHFIRTFKKLVGLSPKQYAKKG